MLGQIDPDKVKDYFYVQICFGLWANIVKVIFLYNIYQARLRQQFIGSFPKKYEWMLWASITQVII